MDFEEQRQRATAVLNRKGVPRALAGPAYGLLTGLLGIKARPLPFEPFWRIVFMSAARFGPCWGLVMWLVSWREEGRGPVLALFITTLAGLFFGLAMAWWVAYTRKKHDLPSWESLATPYGDHKA